MKGVGHKRIQLFPRHDLETDWLQVTQPGRVVWRGQPEGLLEQGPDGEVRRAGVRVGGEHTPAGPASGRSKRQEVSHCS